MTDQQLVDAAEAARRDFNRLLDACTKANITVNLAVTNPLSVTAPTVTARYSKVLS